MSAVMSLDDLKVKLPSLKATLAKKLEEPLAFCEVIRPEDYTSRVESCRQSIKEKRDDLNSYSGLLLSYIEGFIEDGTERRLQEHLEKELGADTKFWKGYIPKMADKLTYPSNQLGDPSKGAARSIWDVKKKFQGNLVGFFDEAALNSCKKLRRQRFKTIKILNDLINQLGLQEENGDQVQKAFLEYCNEEAKLKEMVDGPVIKEKKPKKKISKEKAGEPQQGNELEAKAVECGTEDTQEKKAPKEEMITENSTPEKKELDVGEIKPEGAEESKKEESRTRRNRVPRKRFEQQTPLKKSKPKKNIVVQPPKVEKVEKPKKVLPVRPLPPMPKMKTEMEIEKPSVVIEPRAEPKALTEAPGTPPKPIEVVPVPTKPNNQKKLFDFFTKKEKPTESPIKIDPPQQIVTPIEMEIELSPFDQILRALNTPRQPLQELRQQFDKPNRQTFKQRLVHMFLLDSGYYMSGYDLAREIILANPVEKYSEINYEDSFEEYDEYLENLKADNLDKEEELSKDEQEPASDEGTIVPDGYLSRSEVSSESEAEGQGQNKIVENKAGGDQWYLKNPDFQNREGCMIVALDDEPLPLAVKTQKQKITALQRLQFLKVLHGSYEAMEEQIVKLKERLPDMNKHQIRLNINELSQKEKGSPRLIKPYFLTELEEVIVAEGINLQALIESKKQEYEQEKIRRREDRRQLKQQNGQKNSLLNYTKPDDKAGDKPEDSDEKPEEPKAEEEKRE